MEATIFVSGSRDDFKVGVRCIGFGVRAPGADLKAGCGFRVVGFRG